jgi:hypothetical protein
MRMMQQVLSPAMQHGEEPDLAPQMLGIGRNGTQRLRAGPEQDVIDRGLVLERDGGDRLRHGEHHVEVRHLEQFRLAVRQPLGASQALALRAVSVAARVVGDALMAAVLAALDMTAERCGATVFDRHHRAAPCSRQRRAMAVTERLAEAAEYLRHFQPLAGHGTYASGRHEVRRDRRDGVQRLQRAGGGAHLARGDHQIPRRGAQVAVPEQ